MTNVLNNSIHVGKKIRHRSTCVFSFRMQKTGEYVYLNDTNGINTLGSIVEPSYDSKHPEYYGALHNYGHIMLGQITDPKGKFNVSTTPFPERKKNPLQNKIFSCVKPFSDTHEQITPTTE